MQHIASDKLKYFLQFVESGNISKASQALNISQPALTAQINQFSAEFPLPIFTFSGRKKILTPYGKSVYESLSRNQEIINRELTSINSAFLEEDKATIKIGMRNELAFNLIQDFSFKGHLQILNLQGKEILEQLKNRTIDIGITQQLPRDESIIGRRFFTDHARVIAPKSWVDKNSGIEQFRDMEFLTSKPFLAYKAKPPFLEDWLKQTGVLVGDIPFSIICDDWYIIKKNV